MEKMFMPMEELVDLEKEKARVEKELGKARKNLEGIEKKLLPDIIERHRGIYV